MLTDTTPLITHQAADDLTIDTALWEEKLKKKENLTLSIDEELKLLEQLTQFELGRFLLSNRGLNGYWTAYIILYGLQKQNLHPLEQWLLHHAPVFRATQERFKIFQKTLNKKLRNSMTVGSVPCGLMDDLLHLHHTSFTALRYIGIDYDHSSIKQAAERTQHLKHIHCDFYQKNAWELAQENCFHSSCDLLTSNGLNFYEPDNRKVVDLYTQFRAILKPGGTLVTSILTPPDRWINYDKDALNRQKAIFCDIVETNWQVFRTEEQTREQLCAAGFNTIEYVYDFQKMMPTVVAT